MLQWSPAITAPKNGTVILGRFHDIHPDRLVCMWNDADGEWVAAYPQADNYEGREDRYFENERFHSDSLEMWAEI